VVTPPTFNNAQNPYSYGTYNLSLASLLRG
jgi:hypothetical protein